VTTEYAPRRLFLIIAGFVLVALPKTTSAHGGSTDPNQVHACIGNVNRYMDCGNGAVTDSVTGLVWLKQAACPPIPVDWKAANEAAAGLESGDCALTDGSSAGDWRLATKAEWEATIEN
jgi:hypothetical protein